MNENKEISKKMINENIVNSNNNSPSEEANKNESEIINKELKQDNIDLNKKTINKEIDSKINGSETSPINKSELKPKKELPIEKKPFEEFINSHLIPSLIEEFEQRNLKVDKVNLKNSFRPISDDKCWVIYCEIKDTCNFWLSFEKDDISSSKSISLSKPNQKPSIIESFLIDEKRITLNLIISRILQRLNGQKLIGVN